MTEYTKTRREALRQLQKELSRYKADYDTATANGKTNAQIRLAASLSTKAVIEFMREMPGWQGLDFGFMHLLEALTEVKIGRTPHWLINSSPGAKPIGDRIVICRARLAGVLQYLLGSGQYEAEQAARLVYRKLSADSLRKLAGERQEKEANWRTVARWRENVIKSDPNEDSALHFAFSVTQKHMSGMHGSPEKRAGDMVKLITAQLN